MQNFESKKMCRVDCLSPAAMYCKQVAHLSENLLYETVEWQVKKVKNPSRNTYLSVNDLTVSICLRLRDYLQEYIFGNNIETFSDCDIKYFY